MKKRATIIGAGVFGAAAAKILNSNDLQVTLIDALGKGKGTTSQCTEMFRLHHLREHELWCTLQTLAYAKSINITVPMPYVFLNYDGQGCSIFEKQQELGWKYGLDIEIYNQDQSLKKFPFLKKQVKDKFLNATTSCESECRIDANGLVSSLIEDSDAKFILDQVFIIEENGDIVTRSNGIIESDIVVVAAGPWTGSLLGNIKTGDFFNITPTPYYTLRASGSRPIPYMVVLPDGSYFHPENPEVPSFAVGGISTQPSLQPVLLQRELMENHILKINQYLDDDFKLYPRCEQLTAGSYDVTPSHTLVIERSKINPNVVVFAGGNGHGLMMSVGASLLLEQFLGLSDDPLREQFLAALKSKDKNHETIVL